MRLGMTDEERRNAILDDRETIYELLYQRAFKKGKFTLASGRASDFYLDCKKALTIDGLYAIGDLFVDAIYERFRSELREFAGVGGLTMGADPLAVATCMRAWARGFTNLHPFYVRKEPKKHGTEQWIEGPAFEEGTRVIIVEDVITTGGSALKAIQRVRIHQLNPVMVVALVDRCEDNGRQTLEAEGIPVYALFNRKDFFPDEGSR